MKLLHLLPLAACSAAYVILNEQTANELVIEPNHAPNFPTKQEITNDIKDVFSQAVTKSKNAFDTAIEAATDIGETAKDEFKAWDSAATFDSLTNSDVDDEFDAFDILGGDEHHPPPHRGPPPPHHGPPPPHHGPDGDKGHHGHHGHHCKPNQTVYELIAESKYTTKLAKLISEDDELVKILNGTAANYTVFAPTDSAFEKIPDHDKKPSKELIKKVLLYHISPDFYPAGRVLVTHTIPSLLVEHQLGNEPQRLRLGLWLKGLTVNFESRIVAVDIFGTNGVIHGIDSIILPPIPTLQVIDFLPSEFSTLEIGLFKTGLFNDFNSTTQIGGTFFAPSNFAFQKLGPKINAFLFSKCGQKYLKAILRYHVVANQTLYSDAFYKDDSADSNNIPKGIYHVDLPTLLDGRPLGIDVARFGGFISIKINGFVTVSVQDGIAKDGVIQVVSDVIIPPKKLGEASVAGQDLSIEEIKERLAPYVEADSSEL